MDPHEAALAEILLMVSGEGDGVSLDGRSPEYVVGRVARRMPRKAKKRKAVKPVSAKRKASNEARVQARVPPPEERVAVERDDHSFRKFISQIACCVSLQQSTTGLDPCHLHTKRCAGDWRRVDGELVGNIFPAARRYHEEQHISGIETFAARHGLDLERICRVVGEAYLAGYDPDLLSAMARTAGGYQHLSMSPA